VEYLARYQTLIESHIEPAQRQVFALYPGLPAEAHVVLSRTHGAVVIFTAAPRRRIVFRTIRKRIEHFIWPSTAERCMGPTKTTFVSNAGETVIFVRGKRMRAGGGLTVRMDGVMIYEGRMLLKGDTSIETWSRSAARQDALFAFLREARGQIVDQAKLEEIAAAGQLEADATALALMEAHRIPTTNPETYLSRMNAYLRMAESLGIHTVAAEGLIREIRQELQPRSPGRGIGREWVPSIIQSALGSALIIGIGILLSRLWGWIAFVGGLLLALLWWRWIARSPNRSEP
jgi:hypothetical protein